MNIHYYNPDSYYLLSAWTVILIGFSCVVIGYVLLYTARRIFQEPLALKVEYTGISLIGIGFFFIPVYVLVETTFQLINS